MNTQIMRLDHNRVNAMIGHLLGVIKFDLGPNPSTQQILEALNALGVVTATVLHSTSPEKGAAPNETAMGFFQEVLRVHASEYVEHGTGEKMTYIPGQARN